MEKKYEFTDETKKCGDHILHRIRALRDFGNSYKGELGGFIESEYNLSHYGDYWVYGDAMVLGKAKIIDHAVITDNAIARGNVRIAELARVTNHAYVQGKANICGNAHVIGNAVVYGDVDIRGHAWVMDNAKISDNAKITDGRICGDAYISKDAYITSADDYITIENAGTRSGTTTFYRCTEGIRVNCELFTGDCFNFTLTEFETYIKETYGRSKRAKEYMKSIEYAKYCLSPEKKTINEILRKFIRS